MFRRAGLSEKIPGAETPAGKDGRSQMNQQEFREIVEKAVSGDKDATAQLLFQCKPIIDHYSRVNGRPDEDCRQEVLLYLIQAIRKFRL